MMDSLNKNKTYRILFIGNSYTFFNDMGPTLFHGVAKSAGYTVLADTVTKGAWTLAKFANAEDEMGAKVREALARERYDFIVMQEQSHTPVTNNAGFSEGAGKLVQMIRANGATPVFYETWGRKNGNGDIEKFHLEGHEPMTWRLAAAYHRAGRDYSVAVADVGPAFHDVYTNTEINPYYPDGSHPSIAGSYLAALVIFARIFGLTTTEHVTYLPESVSEETAAVLKTAADKAVFQTPEIPESYRREYGL